MFILKKEKLYIFLYVHISHLNECTEKDSKRIQAKELIEIISEREWTEGADKEELSLLKAENHLVKNIKAEIRSEFKARVCSLLAI